LLLTLLFLCAVGLKRTWNLRTYGGDALALVTGRMVAYGYRTTERFLAQLAQADADGPLTDALTRWTAHLWTPADSPGTPPTDHLLAAEGAANDLLPDDLVRPILYIDGHRKPVYSDVLLPRGLVGRTGKVLGSRTLILLHDDRGHVLLPLTARGDAHLTAEAPRILERYAQATDQPLRAAVVIDREGMGASFLFTMLLAGHTVITCLRSDQYDDLESFTDVGSFIPLTTDAQGHLVREVASARFRLTVPDPEPVVLELQVALVRDHTWRVPLAPPADPTADWCADLDGEAAMWWLDDWVAPPAPPVPTQPKLIPLVSTDPTLDPQAMVRLYTARWPCQENIIKGWLVPLGIDVNHGVGKTPVANSEVAKQRAELEQRDRTLQQRVANARQRLEAALARKVRGQERLQRQQAGMAREVDVETGRRQQEQRTRASQALAQAQDQLEQYCREQRIIRRQLADLIARERPMYALDNRKDQLMTVMKVALTNLAMWVRNQYFPASYAHAGWTRLQPFFQLRGTIQREADQIRVQVRPFNDRALNRDLQVLCTKVAAHPPLLPDGRRLLLEIGVNSCPALDQQRRC